MRLFVRIVGLGLMGLLLGGAFLVALVGMRTGHVFVWSNYWHNPIAAWSVVSTFGLMGVIGVIWVAQRLWRWLRPGGET